MKEGWKYQKLGEITTSINGLWKGKKEPFIHVGVIRNANFTKDFTLDYTNVEYLDVEEKQYKTRKLQRGDLIVEKSGGSEKQPVGRTIIFDKEEGEFSFSNFTSVLRIKDKESILYTFLYKYMLYVYLRGDTREMQKATTGIHNIEFDKFLSIEIPDIPLSEQQQIVDFLDAEFAKIDELKNQAEQSLQNAKDLFQAALKEMLTPKEGWVKKKLADLCSIQSGYAFKSQGFKQEGKYQVIRMGNVRPGIIRYDESAVFVDCDDDQVVRKALLEIGDIIITQTGTRHKRDYGFTAIIDAPNLMLNQRLARIRVGEKLSNKYLLYHTWTDFFRDQFFANEGGTVGQGNVGMDAIKENVISLPPLEHQIFVVETLDSLHKKVFQLQTNYTRTIQLCADLKQALLRQAFE